MYPTVKSAMLEATKREVLSKVGNVQYYESDLVLRAKLKSGQNVVKFGVEDQSPEIDPTVQSRETHLAKADGFVAYSILLGVQKMETVNGAVVPKSDIVTWADSAIFVGAKSGVTSEAKAVNSIWDNGKLSIATGTLTRLENFSTRNLLHETSTLTISENEENKGFYNLATLVPFSGQNTTRIFVQLPVQEFLDGIVGNLAADGTAVAGQYNELVLIIKGFRIVEGAQALKIN